MATATRVARRSAGHELEHGIPRVLGLAVEVDARQVLGQDAAGEHAQRQVRGVHGAIRIHTRGGLHGGEPVAAVGLGPHTTDPVEPGRPELEDAIAYPSPAPSRRRP